MATISKIIRVVKKFKDKTPYFITAAVLDSGMEAEGFGKDYKVGQKVEAYFDERYHRIKMKHKGRFDTTAQLE